MAGTLDETGLSLSFGRVADSICCLCSQDGLVGYLISDFGRGFYPRGYGWVGIRSNGLCGAILSVCGVDPQLPRTGMSKAECAKRYRQNNRERLNAYFAKWQRENPEKTRIWRNRYYKNHPEVGKMCTKRYRTNHPEAHREQEARRRARKNGIIVSETKLIAAWIKSWQAKKVVKCYWCNCGFQGRACQADHIEPLSRGGVHALSNLCIACKSCNSGKKALWLEEWNLKLLEPRLIF